MSVFLQNLCYTFIVDKERFLERSVMKKIKDRKAFGYGPVMLLTAVCTGMMAVLIFTLIVTNDSDRELNSGAEGNTAAMSES